MSEQNASVTTGQPWNAAAELFRRWRSGDNRALDDLVRALTPLLWHVARAHGLAADRAEDVLQNTWLMLVRHRDAIADPQAVGGWLITTTRRESFRVARVESRSRPTEDLDLADVVPAQRSAESEAIVNAETDRLWQGVRQLSDRCQRLLRIIAFADRPDYAGLARDLGMAVGSIGPTRGRCLQQLKSLLAEQTQGAL